MLIGFTGSQGTGKTTTAEAYQENHRGWYIVPSTARAAQKAGYSINRDADPLSQMVTTIARINAENNAVANHDNIISERTPLDSLAYTMYLYNNVWKQKVPYYWHQAVDLAGNHMTKYDYVFYFPPYWPPANDGVRDTDRTWQLEIDHNIKALLEHFEVNFDKMFQTPPASRVEVIHHRLTTLP